MKLGRLVLVRKTLIALERIEADDAAVEVKRLVDGAEIFAKHSGLAAPGSDVHDDAGKIDDPGVQVAHREDPRQQRSAQEQSERPLGFLFGGGIGTQEIEYLVPRVQTVR